MLNSLASYLLGYPCNSSGAPAQADPDLRADVPDPDADVRLKAVEDDDDWLLVDKTDEEVENSASARITLYHWPDTQDESWFVTPPPCFTSASVQLETSPLENLLIEHPSMSVYHHSPVGALAAPVPATAPSAPPNPPNSLSSSVGATPPSRSPQRTLRKLNRPEGSAKAPTSRSSRQGSSPSDDASSSPVNSNAVQTSPRRSNAFFPYQHQHQSVQVRTAQKLVQRAACQQIKRDSLERNNKAREILSSRNKRQRRSDHMQRHSGANNNRKC